MPETEPLIVEKVNEWIDEGYFPGTEQRIIKVRRISMLHNLGYESKMNRDPAFIQEMIAYGEDQAEKFIKGSFAGRLREPAEGLTEAKEDDYGCMSKDRCP